MLSRRGILVSAVEGFLTGLASIFGIGFMVGAAAKPEKSLYENDPVTSTTNEIPAALDFPADTLTISEYIPNGMKIGYEIVQVSGDPALLDIFVQKYQSTLWENWETDKNPIARHQIGKAREDWQKTGRVLLANFAPRFFPKNGILEAVKYCESLGVKIVDFRNLGPDPI